MNKVSKGRPDIDLSNVEFEFVYASSVKCGPGWEIPMKAWPWYRLFLIRGGLGFLHTRTQKIPIHRGHLIFGLPSEIYGFSQNPRRRMTVSVLRFKTLIKKKDVVISHFQSKLLTHHQDLSLIEPLMLKLVQINHALNSSLDFQSSLLKSILWLNKGSFLLNQKAEDADIIAQELKPAIDYPFDREPQGPSMESLARACGMTPLTFRRKFHRAFGCSPKAYIIQKRLNRAKELLLESPYTITSIAEMLGYFETAYFSRQFKHFVGMSPEHFRSSNS
jgi:AraC-like DNA-binding protein